MRVPLKAENGKIRLGVHDGSFHPDDVLCAALLMHLYGKDAVVITRTRDREKLKKQDYVLDVGEEDLVTQERVCLDHHQKDSLVRPNGVKAAACGKLADLVFRDEEDKLKLLREVFLDAVEAEDNGQDLGLAPHPFSFVDAMNLTWREDPARGDGQFDLAARMALTVLERLLETAEARLEAERQVLAALEDRGEDASLLILDKPYPWKETVIAFNAAHPERKAILAVTPDSLGRWRVQTVPVGKGTFRSEKDLPAEWAGLREEALEAACGIRGAVFCHTARFLAVFTTREAALAAARKALETRE